MKKKTFKVEVIKAFDLKTHTNTQLLSAYTHTINIEIKITQQSIHIKSMSN